MKIAEQVDVLVVGAGLTGLTAAAALRQRGHDPMVIDASAIAQHTSRAAVIHARTLEVLEELQVTGQLLERGVIVPEFRVRDRDTVLLDVSFKDLATRYPFTLMCPQDQTETVLRARLHELGGEVAHGVRAVALSAEPDGSMLVRLEGDAAARQVRARYVIGADGGHSVVRDAAGIAFEGSTYAPLFVLADVRMRWPLSRGEVTLFFSEAGLVVVAPLPKDRYRIVAIADEAPEAPSAEYMQALLDTRGPQSSRGQIQEVVWSSRFRVHHRIASRFVKGPILLAGDAAHVHSPAGGQGMNTGIQDALAAADALSRTLVQGELEALACYEADRRAIAAGVVALTDRLTRVATLRSLPARHLRNAMMPLIGSLPTVRRRIARTLAELDNA